MRTMNEAAYLLTDKDQKAWAGLSARERAAVTVRFGLMGERQRTGVQLYDGMREEMGRSGLAFAVTGTKSALEAVRAGLRKLKGTDLWAECQTRRMIPAGEARGRMEMQFAAEIHSMAEKAAKELAGEAGSPYGEPVVCPTCAGMGARSRAHIGGRRGTMLPVDVYWDEDGLRHEHDPNGTVLKFVCSNGHQWERVACCWCEASRGPKARKFASGKARRLP